MIKIAIIEDDDDFRESLAILINKRADFHCTSAYPDCESALQNIERDAPDVILMDIGLPGMPQVTVHNLDGEVLLSWDNEVESYVAADKVDVDEEGNPTAYTFQGYNVYQANSATVGPGVSILKLATFDVADGVGDIKDFVFSEEFGEVVEATVQRAPDTGVQRLVEPG